MSVPVFLPALLAHAVTTGPPPAGRPAAAVLHHLAAGLPLRAPAVPLAAGSLIQSVDWIAVAPPLATALAALAVLVADLFLPPERKPVLGRMTAGGLALALLCLIPLRPGTRATFCLGTVAHTADNAGCSYVADHLTLVFQLIALGGALVVALISAPAVERERMPAGEYWFLLLGSATGAALLPAARDLATLVIALETLSLPAFALVGLRRDARGGEAALTFFLSSVAATAVTLLGASFLYAATGSLHLTGIATGLARVPPGPLGTLAGVGAVLTLVGFAFKVAAVPFHFWLPDTYVGAPVPVAAYLSVVSKTAGIAGLALVTTIALPPDAELWGPLLAALAAATMTAGNVAALRQPLDRAHSAVRLLAWSSVAQAGYMLVPLAAAGQGQGDDPLGATAAYALVYGLVNLGAFAVVAAVGRRAPGNSVDDYRGLFARRPVAALALAFFLLCLAGLPPGVVGLFAKVVVLRAAVDSGLGWLAVLMAANVVVALYYYLVWTARLFAPAAGGARKAAFPSGGRTGTAADAADAAREPLPLPLAAAVALALGLGVVLSVAPQVVLRVVPAGFLG